ncbi:MAG TPA: tetratricopeptide repeat protein [Methylomirabilota bacterium]|jgi:tetratricopeptide (TPR) repeat protein
MTILTALAAALALALGLLVPGAGAQTRLPLTREQALTQMKSEDVELRRQGTAWLGELGLPGDAPPLIAALTDPDEVVRVLAENSVWQVWTRSGDTEIDGLMLTGMEQMNRGDGPGAVETFTKIIERRPDFAEGWNKRATVYFLMGENEKSLHDCDEVMKRNPAHFGALAGYGQIYLRMDQPERALTYFRRALRINPNMRGVQQVIPEIEQLLTERRKGTI